MLQNSLECVLWLHGFTSNPWRTSHCSQNPITGIRERRWKGGKEIRNGKERKENGEEVEGKNGRASLWLKCTAPGRVMGRHLHDYTYIGAANV